MFKRFFTEEQGAAMTEYALLLALIAIISIVILSTMGDQVSGVFQLVSDNLPVAP